MKEEKHFKNIEYHKNLIRNWSLFLLRENPAHFTTKITPQGKLEGVTLSELGVQRT